MRIRTIKPEFWTSDDVTALAVEDRLLFIGLWSYVDDNGVGRDEDHLIVSALFSRDMYENPRETVARIQRGLAHLSDAGLIHRYEVDGRPFLQVATWENHQRIDRPNKARFPRYDANRDTLATPSRDCREDSAPGTEEQRNRGTGEQGNSTPPDGGVDAHAGDDHPTQDDAPRKRAAATKGTRIPDDWTPTPALADWTRREAPAAATPREVERFRDYWTAQPGARGRKTSWDATWRNWARRAQDDADGARTRRGGYTTQADLLAEATARAHAHTQATQGSALALIEGGLP